jgi:hypothetical protein
MGDVTELRSGIRLSISQIAVEFSMSRNTVARRIDQLGLRPDGKRGGYAVYRLRDVAAIVAPEGPSPSASDFDPTQLPPSERRAWFQSENERLKAEAEQRQLIPAGEVETEMAVMVKTVVRALETLPDRAERDLRCPPEVVEFLQNEVYALRVELQDQVSEAEAGA